MNSLLLMRSTPEVDLSRKRAKAAKKPLKPRFSNYWEIPPDYGAWLTAYTTYYNHDRSHQTLENQTPIKALELEGSIYRD